MTDMWRELEGVMREIAPPNCDEYPGISRWAVHVCDDIDAVEVRAIAQQDTWAERWFGLYRIDGEELKLFTARWKFCKSVHDWAPSMKDVLRFMNQAYAPLAWRMARTEPKLKRLSYYRRPR